MINRSAFGVWRSVGGWHASERRQANATRPTEGVFSDFRLRREGVFSNFRLRREGVFSNFRLRREGVFSNFRLRRGRDSLPERLRDALAGGNVDDALADVGRAI